MKPAGAIIVVLGALVFFRGYTRALRHELNLIRDITGGLTQLAGEIRWKVVPIPDVIANLSNRKEAGKLFREVMEYMESGNTLQSAWVNTFSSLTDPISGIMCSMEWGGDLRRQEDAILYTAKQMAELGEEKRDVLHQREKVCAAAALSAAGLLIVILM